MRLIVSLAVFAGMVLLNFVSTAFGQAFPDVVKTPAPPPPLIQKGSIYNAYVIGGSPGFVPEDTVGYEFDLLFDTNLLTLISARDSLVEDSDIDIAPIPDGLRLSAMGSRAVPDEWVTTLFFSADEIGTTEITVNPFIYYAASGPGGEIVAFPLPTGGPDTITLTVVPEPSSVVLAGIGIVVLVSARRRYCRSRPPDRPEPDVG